MQSTVFILDDEPNIIKDLSTYISRAGYEVFASSSAEEANNIIKIQRLDYAIIDLKIDYTSDYSGIKVIENINKLQPQTKIIALSAYWLTSDLKKQLEKTFYYSFVSKGGAQNYIKAVIEELTKLRNSPPPKTCFVIMPFSNTNRCTKEQWGEIFENMIKPAVEGFGIHYQCHRACLDIGNIIKDILININHADVVIADLTDRNPNVFYELGVRHALRNVTILITQKIDDVPFDLRHYALVQYDWTTRLGREQFAKTIARILRHIEDNPTYSGLMSPVLEYLKV